MVLEHMLTIVGVALYALSSLLAVLSLARTAPLHKGRVATLLATGAIPLAVVLGIHAARSGHLPVFGRFEAASCYVLITTAAYLRIASLRRMEGTAAILTPFLTGVLLWGLSATGRAPDMAASRHTTWLALHACTAFIACALFSLAGILAIVYLVQDYNLKQKRLGKLFDRLPALESLDRLMSHHVGIAFLVLTLSMGIGFIPVRHSGDTQGWLTDPKVAASLVTWAFYAVVVHMRASAGRHGKGVAIVTVLGFCCVLLIFLGVYATASGAHSSVLSMPYGLQ